jgi:hypothetical protein
VQQERAHQVNQMIIRFLAAEAPPHTPRTSVPAAPRVPFTTQNTQCTRKD